MPTSKTSAKSEIEEINKQWPKGIWFALRTLVDDRLIGMVRLKDINWAHGHTELAIGIPGPYDWGKGFGTDAMNLILHHGFDELSLFRIWLATNGYNTRAIRPYEKLGFREEGRLREHIHRDDQRWDLVIMGLLRHEFTRM